MYKVFLIFRVVLKQQTEGGMGIFTMFLCLVWSLYQVTTPVNIVIIRIKNVNQLLSESQIL